MRDNPRLSEEYIVSILTHPYGRMQLTRHMQ